MEFHHILWARALMAEKQGLELNGATAYLHTYFVGGGPRTIAVICVQGKRVCVWWRGWCDCAGLLQKEEIG